ncbi:Ig-like domain-containing protein [candidate division WOR-3 bacterium]|nr:Ig-like domain-containing protein [candidate division WOR-3 bacterium]
MKKDKKDTSKKPTKKTKKTISIKVNGKKFLEKIKQKKVWIPSAITAGIILAFLLLYPQIKKDKTRIQRDTYESTYQHEYETPPAEYTPQYVTSDELKITNYGPTGESRGQVQISINFNNPIIPLTTLSDEVRDSILNHFNLEPPIEGKFRILGTSGVVFEPEHSLPMATYYIVTVKKGIKDIAGNTLSEDFSWEFKTPLPDINISPYNGSHHIKLDQEVYITSNTSLNLESLKNKIEFFETETKRKVNYKFLEHEKNPEDEQDIGMYSLRYNYILKPVRELKKDTRYTVIINPGVMTERGNRPTEREYTTIFTTYPPFRFIQSGFCDHCGYKLTTPPYIAFTNEPEWESAEKNVIISPKAEENPLRNYSDCYIAYDLGVDDNLLEPNTKYTVNLRADLTDIYGQKLGNPQQISFTTGELTPKMWGPSGYQIITPNIEPKLGIKTVNIDKSFFIIQGLEPKDILVRERLNYYYSIDDLINNLRTEELRQDIKLNDVKVGKAYFDLGPYLRAGKFGAVAYRFTSPQVKCYSNPITFNGLILRTNIGIYTQLHPTGGIIKLNQLTDGKPIDKAKIKIYREDDLPRLERIWDLITDKNISRIAPCFEGATDSEGLLTLSSSQMQKCTKRRISNKILNELYPPEADPDDILYDQERFGFAEPPTLLIVAEKDDDWTFIHTESGGNPSLWNFGISSDWEAERPLCRGTIFSDQHLYRPGDTVRLKGVVRYLLYGKLLTGKEMPFEVKLRDPHGGEKQIGQVRVNEFGTFDLEIPTKEGQPLGYYNITAENTKHNLRFYGNFRLAEFRVPEFEVKMDVNKKIVLPGEPFRISWEGNYYFGAPMAKASSSLNITRRRTYFRPEGWEGFSFGVPYYLQEEKSSISGSYLRETIELDETGKASKTITLRRDDVPYNMTYLCDVEVTDVSRQTSSVNKSITVLPDKRLIGIKLNDWIIAAKDILKASVIVSSPEGEALKGIPLTVKLIKREYHSVKTKTPEGKFRVENTLVKKVISTKEIISTITPREFTFSPEEAGSYFVLAELTENPNSGTAAAASVWVAGESYVPWEETGEDKLEIIMDKDEYKVGDTVKAFIKSPFPEAELFITVCREKILLKDSKKIKGGGFTYNFVVTEDMLPNAYVGAVLYRLGEAIVPVEEETGKHMEKIGFKDFNVSISDKYLQVEITPSSKKLRPAEELNVDIKVTRTDRKGHRSELTVMIVDEAVLSLTGYTPPDLVQIVYAHRGLSARITDNRPFIITKEELLQKGYGYGGGAERMVGGPMVRKKFLKLAYYNPHLVTDKNGQAHFSFKLPDNLTTWRIMVVSIGENDLFGYKDEKVVATQPFVLRPILPRFARIGDEFNSGVAITNSTEGEGVVKVSAELSGESIILNQNEAQTSETAIKSGQSTTILFPFKAACKGESTLKFTAYFTGTFGGEKIKESDAVQTTLMVKELLATETVVAVGETKEEAEQAIKVDESVRKDMGGLEVTLSSTALTNIGEGAKYLVEYPYGCLEQTSSRLLALVQLKFLSDKYSFELEAVKPVDKVIEANIRKILLMQNSDGGFKFWPTSWRSDCYLSPYVAYLFKRCEDLGYKIPDDAKNELLNFLEYTLRNPCYPFFSWKALAEYRINILLGMHYLDKNDETYFEEYFNRRNELSFGAQISLAFLLYKSGRWEKEAQTLLKEIKNGMFVTAQTAHFESPKDLPPSWLFMYSPIITTADATKLFLEMEPESEFISKFARYMLNARKNGRWRYTYENAKAMDALVEISLKREAEPPKYSADLFIAGEKILTHMFKGHQYKPFEEFIPIAKLPEGLAKIELSKKGSGYLYYVLSYSYRLKGAQASRNEGLTIKRTVRNKDTGKLIAEYENKPLVPVNIKAGDVLEVELEFKVKQTSYHLVIDDPIPSGLEAIDASLVTTSTRYDIDSQERTTIGGSWNPINHTELRDDRVALFSDMVKPGIYKYKYLLRATTSGYFLWPCSKVSLMYEPEQFGTSSEGFIKILNE